jgi:Flp pilus assembly protein CpaB
MSYDYKKSISESYLWEAEMRRGRIFLILALIVLIILGAVYIVTKVLNPEPETTIQQPVDEVPPAPTPIPVMDVVVVTQRVVRGEVLREDKLTIATYQADVAWPIMFTSIDQVVGKIARFSMEPYTVVTSALVTDVADREQGSDDALFIENGMVAVSIPVSRLSSISYAPARGDRVNVIVTLSFVDIDPEWNTILPNMTGNVIAPGGGTLVEGALVDNPETTIATLMAQPYSGTTPLGRIYEDLDLEQLFYLLPSETQRPRLVSQTLIQNVMVLQLGNFPTPYERALAEMPVEPTPTPNPAAQAEQPAAEEEVTPPPPPDVITLIVTPQDAVTLNYLIFSGAKLTLAMRNPQDTSVVPTEAVTMSFLLDAYNIPIPVKLPYGFQPAVSELVQPVLENDVLPTQEP